VAERDTHFSSSRPAQVGHNDAGRDTSSERAVAALHGDAHGSLTGLFSPDSKPKLPREYGSGLDAALASFGGEVVGVWPREGEIDVRTKGGCLIRFRADCVGWGIRA
jgi:hypothetical protein